MADVVEAIVGAAYISSQRSLDVGITAMKRMRIPVTSISSWSDLTDALGSSTGSGEVDTADIMGYRFQDKAKRSDCFVSTAGCSTFQIPTLLDGRKWQLNDRTSIQTCAIRSNGSSGRSLVMPC